MQAVRWHGTRDLRLEEVDLTLPLGPGMVEVEVRFAGICGSDVAEFRGPFAIRPGHTHALSGQSPPVTLGHEFSGVITALGEGVEGLEPGQRVSADACWRCNRCAACASGHYNLCALGGSIGLVSDGAFAPLVRFPSYCVVPLPDSVGDEEAALLEPLAVGLHALGRAAARAGDTVVVLGFGAIGACTALVAGALGLDVVVGEISPSRLARAEAAGYRVFDPSGSAREVGREVRRMTGGGAEVVVDCTGAGASLEAAPDMTRRGGRIVVTGIPKQPVSIDAGRLVLFERALLGTLGYANDLPRVATMIATGALEPGDLITRRVELAEVPAVITQLADAPGDDIKVMVEVGRA